MRLSPPTAPSFGARLHFGVPGGMCGVPYDHHISVPPGLRLKAVYLDERCGVRALAHAPEHLVGTPLVDGTHLLRLECLDANGATVVGEARLVVSRDPRSLWRNVPSDPAMPHWKPDHASERIESRGWCAHGVSRRGRSHAHAGKCREDDMALRVVGQEMLVVALADGAGSASLSRLGSRVAVTAAIEVLGAEPFADRSGAALHARLAHAATAANSALQCTAAKYAVACSDLSTTLLLCALLPGPEPLLACLQIGDGVIAARTGTGIRPVCAADRGEYAGQTAFVTAASVAPAQLAKRIQVQSVPELQWVLLASDGVSDPYLETEQAVQDAECWAPIAIQLDQAALSDAESAEQQLTHWLDGFTPGHHDDRTLVLLHAAGARG